MALVGTNGQGIGTSPLSRWVRNCDALEISAEEREKLDQLIDNIYDQLDKGEFVFYTLFLNVFFIIFFYSAGYNASHFI